MKNKRQRDRGEKTCEMLKSPFSSSQPNQCLQHAIMGTSRVVNGVRVQMCTEHVKGSKKLEGLTGTSDGGFSFWQSGPEREHLLTSGPADQLLLPDAPYAASPDL